MPLLKRLSDSLWSYLSPSRSIDDAHATPKTIPRRAHPVGQTRSSSVQEKRKHSRSRGTSERVGKWKATSPSERFATSRARLAHKRPHSPVPGTERMLKTRKMDSRNFSAHLMDAEDAIMYDDGLEIDSDMPMGDGSEGGETSEAGSDKRQSYASSNDQVTGRDSSSDHEGETSQLEAALLNDESEPFAPQHRQLITPAQAAVGGGLSAEELRLQGWETDHIFLVERLTMRGYEPIMPAFWHFDFRHWMPDNLFSDTDEAIINSAHGKQNEARVALERLFGFGSWVRDALLSNGNTSPELQVRKYLQEYMKWAHRDSGLDSRTAIPLLTIQLGNADTPPQALKDKAERRLAKLANRYREAFRVRRSIEHSPFLGSTPVSRDIPTLYAIIASHTLIALVAYPPNDARPEIKSIAFFDMSDKDYDVWNAFALAITVCHLRNVQMRIAEETGLGLPVPGAQEIEDDDPDL